MKICTVALLAGFFINLASVFMSPVQAAEASSNSLPATSVVSADQLADELVDKDKDQNQIGGVFLISRSTSLYDHQDGTRKDGVDYAVLPSVKTSLGNFSSKIVYSQDLRDESESASDFSDIPITYAMIANKWLWSPPYIITLTPTLTALIPVSKNSRIRDMLQTAVAGGLSFGIEPDGIATAKDGAWSLALGITAGRSFHTYEEDINGKVLNKFSSNQTVNLGYTYKVWSLSVEYIHKSRWTYQGNSKDTFEHTEELGYAVNENFAVAIGHTNTGAGLKANGMDSNFDLINENESQVYGQLGLAF